MKLSVIGIAAAAVVASGLLTQPKSSSITGVAPLKPRALGVVTPTNDGFSQDTAVVSK